MRILVRSQFSNMPTAEILGQILALAAMSDDYENSDILEDS